MKFNCLNAIIIVCLLILVSGCGKDGEISGNIVENISEAEDTGSVVVIGNGEAESQESDSAETEENNNDDIVVIDYDEDTNAELVEELMKGLVDEDSADTADEEKFVGENESDDEVQEIIIESFRGDPKDLTVEAGTTVRWTNNMYFNHIIIILPEEEGGFANRWINGLEELWFGESYEYTFEEAGKYQWGSKSKFDVTKGFIIVVE